MKKLGLIGGMGPESTIVYYHDILYGVKNKLGMDVFPPISIDSINLYEMLEYCDNDNSRLIGLLEQSIENLAAGGAQFAALTSNTSHLVYDALAASSPIPLVSIIDTTCAEVERLGYKKVGLLGTTFTTEGNFFREPFASRGINLVTPDAPTRRFVSDRITSELEIGLVKESTLNAFNKIISDMHKENGIEAVILGCTELPLLFKNAQTPVVCLDTMQLHIAALVDMIIE